MFLTTLLVAAALQGRPASVLPAAETSPATVEGIEILRRILADAIDEAFEEEKKEGDKIKVRSRQGYDVHGLVTTLWAGDRTIEHSRAFHLPEVGLFFSLDAGMPVVARAQESEAPSDRPSDDEWERTRREVRGDQPSGAVLFRRANEAEARPAEIDPAAVERLIDLVLETLARHTGRIEGLGSRETVTIGLRLHGKRGNWLHDFGQDGFTSLYLEGSGADERPESVEREAPPVKHAEAYAYLLGPGQEAREQSLVIRIALSDLAANPNGDPRQLRQRALVNLY